MTLGFTVSSIEKFWCAPILCPPNSFETTWLNNAISSSGVPGEGGLGCSNPLLPEIPNALPKSCQTQPDCENC